MSVQKVISALAQRELFHSSSGQKERKYQVALAVSRAGISGRNEKAEIQKAKGQNQQQISKLKG